MRNLHPVAAGEKFIARGDYQRTHNGEMTRYSEQWTLHGVGDGQLLRMDQDARFSDVGWSRLAEILRDANGKIERLNVRYDHSQADFKVMLLDYIFYDDYVQMSRKIDAAERVYSELPLPPGAFVRLLEFNVCWGAALQRSAAGFPDDLPVFIPFFNPKVAPGRVVQGKLPQVNSVQDEMLQRGEKSIAAQRYETNGRIVWLDEHAIPLKIQQTHGYVDTLVNYAYARS